MLSELDQANKCIEALNICIKQDDEREADLKRIMLVLVSTLENVEYRMSKSPEFNPWDLGPTGILEKVRAALALARGEG